MKIISLNTWGGRAGLDNLLGFLKQHTDTDMFCLQEIWSGGEHMLNSFAAGQDLKRAIPRLLPNIEAALKEHLSLFKPHFYDFYGLAMLVRKDLEIIEEGDIFVHKHRGYIPKEEIANHARNIQYVTLRTQKGDRTVINFHGLWSAGGKVDTEDRLKQSDSIVSFLKNLSTPFVLCGDFNLLPETESLKKIESIGLRNLIKEYGVTSTRTSFYTKEHRLADYMLVSEGISINTFQVLPDEVSDHSPLLLDFE